MRIILASASPRRKELLTQIGMAYEVVPSTVEEKMEGTLPEEIVQGLSAQKAEDVCGRFLERGEEDFLVIGADTVVALDGSVMGKTGGSGGCLPDARTAAGKDPPGIYRRGVVRETKGRGGYPPYVLREDGRVHVPHGRGRNPGVCGNGRAA